VLTSPTIPNPNVLVVILEKQDNRDIAYLLVCHYGTYRRPKYFLNNINPWVHVEIYLVAKPSPTTSIHHEKDPMTELVSPQFSVPFDNMFQTVSQIHLNVMIMWTY
jgi:hypothetical protein